MICKLIVTDFDGTLVDQTAKISEKNKDAVKYAINKGVKVIISSGRSNTAVNMFEKELGLCLEGNYGIGFNGGIIHKSINKESVFEEKLDNKIAINIIKTLKKMNYSPVAYVGGELFVDNLDDCGVREYIKVSKMKEVVINSLLEIKDDINKILICNKNDILKNIYNEMKEISNNNYNMLFTDSKLLEFFNINVSKGNAMQHISKFLNIDLMNIIAIGDNYNDESMITKAGLGVCMKNGVEEVKKIADYVTKKDCSNDGFAEVIYKFV